MSRTVVHFVDSNIFGGIEEVILTLLAGFDRKQWRPMLFYYESPGMRRLLAEASELGVPSRPVPRMNRDNRVGTLRQFARELHAVKPSIFHAHLGWALACRHGLCSAKLSRVPAIVATQHLSSPVGGERFGWMKKRIQTATIDRYTAVSDEVKKHLGQHLNVPEVKIRVVYNGIRVGRFESSVDYALRYELSQGNHFPIVFTPARLHKQKGHVFLLQAATAVPNALFVFAGDGPERDCLMELARDLGLESRVRFLGERQDIPRLLASCDLFVLPSLFEGLPMSVLEAMAAVKPIVATNVGGTNEAVIDGATGILVPPGDPVKLATAIRTLIEDQGFAARLAKAGKKRVVELFSSDAMVSGVSQVYEDLLAEKALKARALNFC